MAFQASDLSVLAYANGFTMFHYKTVDNTATIEGAGYFNGAVNELRKNDLLVINIDTDGTPSTKFYVVTGNDGSTVTVAVYA